MPNLASVLKDEIRRLARREVNAETKQVRKLLADHRRYIASLRKEIADLRRELTTTKQVTKRVADAKVDASDDGAEGLRFSAKGLASHRQRLGLSAAEMGKLIGVSQLTVYNLEKQKTTPRRSQLPKIAEVREMGKREALARLEELD